MKQFLITPAAGKRLIGKALAEHSHIIDALENGTIVIVAGTTNGYVAEEILTTIGQSEDFSRKRFFRGIVLPPSKPRSNSGRLYDDINFFGDVVIEKGVWKKGLTIYDVIDQLDEGDVILKGANSVDLTRNKAGIYIGHPEAGTIGAALPVVFGRRVRLIIPVGLEKRVSCDLDDIAKKLNVPGLNGPRLLPVSGEVFTELEALDILCNVKADLIAGGGVSGAEGSVWLGITGDENSLKIAERVIKSVSFEEPFNI